MPDCFISYSSEDVKFAEKIKEELETHNLSVFMAPISIRPGQNWTDVIWQNLRNCPWVIFLASKMACLSPYVQQELGAALETQKKIVPIVWEIDPSELPGWINQKHAIDLRGCDLNYLRTQIQRIAEEIKSDKAKGLIIVGSIILGLLLLSSK